MLNIAYLNIYTLNNIGYLKEPFSTITMQPQENPARVLLLLDVNSIEGFLLKDLGPYIV